MGYLDGFLSNQAKNKSDSALLREARNNSRSSSVEKINDAHRTAARKELLNRGYNPKTGKFDK